MSAARTIAAAVLLLCCAPLAAQERTQVEMQGISIIGDRDLPNVLYIVPWKDAAPVELAPQPHEPRGDLLPGRLERDAVQRQLRHRHNANE